MKLGIFGGSFDPPHRGHASAAAACVNALGLDKLLVIPDNAPPHKSLSENTPGAEERATLTRLCMRHVPKARVSDMELRRGGKSYTVDTVFEAAKEYPDAKIYLLLGTDMLESFERWKDCYSIMERATIVVFTRRESELRLVREKTGYLQREYGARVKIVEHEEVEISSTDLRAMLPKRGGVEFFDDKEYSEIIKHRYYDAKPDFQWLRGKAYEMLDARRVAHVQGTEITAERLAKRWGADADEAREAAILHDITKKEDSRTQLRLCEKYGITLDDMEKEEGKLLHSKTGAAIAKYEFGCSDDVFNAIYWHTTGRENMALLEKIIYMADYIEPTREFDNVDEMREMAFKDLDLALKMGFTSCIADMNERGVRLHARTIGALQWITDELSHRKTENIDIQ